MGRYDDDYSFYPRRATAAERQATVRAETAKMATTGKPAQPIAIEGRQIAKTFWGKAWCDHIECLSDFASRLDRGKTYARNGSVFHLEISQGKVAARVAGSEVYDITVEIQPLDANRWADIKRACAGQITSAVELLSGQLSDATMRILTDADTGMFPGADDFDLDCSCPDFARLCKHLAAVLYGVGARLDTAPEFLFTLRGVDPTELLTSAATHLVTAPGKRSTRKKTVASADLSDVFGIELASDEAPAVTPEKPAKQPRPKKPKPPAAKPKRRSK
jgi:uncharacterized Zn finger protein